MIRIIIIAALLESDSLEAVPGRDKPTPAAPARRGRSDALLLPLLIVVEKPDFVGSPENLLLDELLCRFGALTGRGSDASSALRPMPR